MAAQGVGVATAPGLQSYFYACEDGHGGVLVAWSEEAAGQDSADIYVQRVTAYGVPSWSFPVGVLVTTAPGRQVLCGIAADGTGGCVVVWHEERQGGDYDIYAQRVASDGTPWWATDGTAISTNDDLQVGVGLAGDGARGAIFAWRRGDPEWPEGDICVQWIERNGYLGYPSPYIVQATDYPDDQGGMAVVSCVASYLDAFPQETVTEYSV